MTQCAKCESETLVRLPVKGAQSTVGVVLIEKPDAVFFPGVEYFEFEALVCGDCGFSELYVKEFADMYKLHGEITTGAKETDGGAEGGLDQSQVGRLSTASQSPGPGDLSVLDPPEKCSKCQQENPSGFESCWNCQTPRTS